MDNVALDDAQSAGRLQQAPRIAGNRRPSAAAATAGGQVAALGGAIARVADDAAQTHPGGFRLRIPESRQAATIELSRRWLTVALPLCPLRRRLDADRIGALLRRNARLPGCLRLIGDRLGPRRRLVSDVPAELLPWHDDHELDACVAALIDDLRCSVGNRARTDAIDRPRAPANDDLEQLLTIAGWAGQRDAGGRIEIPLDVPGEYAVAAIEYRQGDTRLSVRLLEPELQSATPAGRQALTMLLWLTAGTLRMVRPGRTRRTLELDVCMPPLPVSPEALGHGLAALSTAARQLLAAGRLLLADERLAAIYLHTLGTDPSRPPARASAPITRSHQRSHQQRGVRP